MERVKTWQEILKDFCLEMNFPKEALLSLQSDLSRLCQAEENRKEFARWISTYKGPGTLRHGEALEALNGLSDKSEVSSYATHLLFYILLSPVLRSLYRERGIADRMYLCAMEDLRCKLMECHTVYGVWGSFVAIWFSRFFEFTLYGIGRLEFAPMRFRGSYEGPSGRLKQGDFVIDTHIPSKGRLSYDEVDAAYREAAEFFQSQMEQGQTPVFFCESWMLFPAHEKILSETRNANLLRFQRDYEILRWGDDEGGSDLWRIFGRDVDLSCREDIEALPAESSLQKAYKSFLLQGGKPGFGEGVYFMKSKERNENA